MGMTTTAAAGNVHVEATTTASAPKTSARSALPIGPSLRRSPAMALPSTPTNSLTHARATTAATERSEKGATAAKRQVQGGVGHEIPELVEVRTERASARGAVRRSGHRAHSARAGLPKRTGISQNHARRSALTATKTPATSTRSAVTTVT